MQTIEGRNRPTHSPQKPSTDRHGQGSAVAALSNYDERMTQSPSTLLYLQRTIGNRAVQRMLTMRAPSTNLIQAKRGYNVVLQAVTMRTAANDSAEPVEDGDLEVGDGCIVLQEQGGWSRIRVGMLQGYVRSNCLRKEPEPRSLETHYRQVTNPLFGESDQPETDDVKQGNLSDCFLLAPLAAVANTPNGKMLIHGLFTEVDGKYEIQLYDIGDEGLELGEKIQVDRWLPSTNQGNFEYCPGGVSMTSNAPIWASLIEKAWAQDTNHSKYSEVEYLDTSTAMSQLTGKTTYSLRWNAQSETMVAVPENTSDLWHNAYNDDELNDVDVQNMDEDVLLQQLVAAKSNVNHAVVAESLDGTGDDSNYLDEGLQISDKHVYIVFAVNAQARTITLRNPTGNHPPAPLSIGDFKRLFDRVLKVDLNSV